MNTATAERTRLKIRVRGAVQGVGFRPFVFRLATGLGLTGRVHNSAQGVFIEVEGARETLQAFLLRLEKEKPPHSFIQSLEASWLDAVGFESFEIHPSETGGRHSVLVLPDIATCPECVAEVLDPANRRYFYPFTNCTHCGPRFSIIESLPYDRANTAMKKFPMCPQCRAEYDDPRNRRFHAQPNACPVCGPQLDLWDRDGHSLLDPDEKSIGADSRRNHRVLSLAADAVRAGKIVAVKGIGGFHLMVAAHDDAAIRRLRELKHREEKPFALMFPSMPAVRAATEVSPLEERLLRSPEAPIVLLRRRSGGERSPSNIAPSVAPGNPFLGILLPYAPLHHLLMSLLDFPVVATSGNLSDEPICIEEREALERLGGIADLFLVHNRPIVRHVDDSIVRVMMHREMVLRRARGYAPLPVEVSSFEFRVSGSDTASGEQHETRNTKHETVLAVGGHLKNAVCLSSGSNAFISQHIGDLETVQSLDAFRRVIADFETLYDAAPTIVAADAHPDYSSTRFARTRAAEASSINGAVRYVSVQHHVAHVFSCMAENELEPPLLGVAWDGTGYGTDGTIWGGEFFHVRDDTCVRVAHWRPFRLPGGEKAVKEPRRSALGLLYEWSGNAVSGMRHLPALRSLGDTTTKSLVGMLERRVHCPVTSSAGRLFDAVAALIGVRQQSRFEGQAAMELEFAVNGFESEEAYPIAILNSCCSVDPAPAMVLDWGPMVESILADVADGIAAGTISAKFHNALAEAIVNVANCVGEERVALSGGCFQNRYLTERVVRRLTAEGFRPYWHQRVPPNDGGIALGQVAVALFENRKAVCV